MKLTEFRDIRVYVKGNFAIISIKGEKDDLKKYEEDIAPYFRELKEGNNISVTENDNVLKYGIDYINVKNGEFSKFFKKVLEVYRKYHEKTTTKTNRVSPLKTMKVFLALLRC